MSFLSSLSPVWSPLPPDASRGRAGGVRFVIEGRGAYPDLVMSAKNATPETAAAEPPRIEIKVPALLAGTVTSVIVAVLASRLGVQGTLIGAAFTSLVFGLISPFLTFGLQRTHEGLKIVAARRRPAADPSAVDPDADAPGEVLAEVEVTTARSRRRVPLGVALAGAVVTALVTFGSTLGVVTALESAAGRSVDGGYATTVEGITKPAATTTAARPDASSLNAQRTPSPTPSATPSATESPDAAPATDAPAAPAPDETSVPVTSAPAPTASVPVEPAPAAG